jgi:Mn-dependent DtxR family transcriptional regulator
MEKLSFTMESYLDAIYELSGNGVELSGNGAELPRNGFGVRLKDVAKRIGVTKSTANAAMCALAGKKLIRNERYRSIQLTEAGIAAARDIAEKHGIIRRFFSEILEMGAAEADKDACAIEHVISDGALRAMRGHLARMDADGQGARDGFVLRGGVSPAVPGTPAKTNG